MFITLNHFFFKQVFDGSHANGLWTVTPHEKSKNVVESMAFYRILCPVADVRIGRTSSQIILTESMMTWSFYEFDRNY